MGLISFRWTRTRTVDSVPCVTVESRKKGISCEQVEWLQHSVTLSMYMGEDCLKMDLKKSVWRVSSAHRILQTLLPSLLFLEDPPPPPSLCCQKIISCVWLMSGCAWTKQAVIWKMFANHISDWDKQILVEYKGLSVFIKRPFTQQIPYLNMKSNYVTNAKAVRWLDLPSV